jgi:hypothetical protein
VAEYRLYFIRDGHFWRVEEFAAADDAEATEEAQRRRRNAASELWARARKVASFERGELAEPCFHPGRRAG